jgi:chromosome segregation ATPase
MAVGRDQPGPSSGRTLRRRQEDPRDIAELYARLQDVEAHTGSLEDVTSLRYGEITQQISRLDSNAETQKKWVGQRLELVEEHARTADERMSGFQSQIDSVRQQTQDLHQSLLAVHDHSQQLTSGLSTVIDKFKNLCFDLPAILDDWSRMNNENREGRVVTTDQLHIPGMPHVPSLPRLSRSLEPPQPPPLPI